MSTMTKETNAVRGDAEGEWVPCVDCRGMGLVSVFSGVDFEGPAECRVCGGDGRLWRYPSGHAAQYPGGPARGYIATDSEQEAAGQLTLTGDDR